MRKSLLHWSTQRTRLNDNNGKVKHLTHCGKWILSRGITLRQPSSEWVNKFSEKFCEKCRHRIAGA
ncbi:MAG: hypothetical protein ACWGO2_07165 [Syntrophobacteria bacterium]